MHDVQGLSRQVALVVRVVQRAGDRRANQRQRGQGHVDLLAPGTLEQGGQVGSRYVLHGDEVGVLGEAQVEHLHDVRVRQGDRDLRLVDEHLDELRVAGQLGEDAFDDEDLLEAGHAVALGAIHLGHAAARDALEQLVLAVADAVTRHGRGRVSLGRDTLTSQLQGVEASVDPAQGHELVV